MALLLAAVGFDTENVVATTDQAAHNVMRLSIWLPLVGAVLMFLALMLFIIWIKRKPLRCRNASKVCTMAKWKRDQLKNFNKTSFHPAQSFTTEGEP